MVLKTALEQYDLYNRAQRQLKREKLTVPTAAGKKTNPLVTVMRTARDGFLASMRMLGLGLDVADVGRPVDKRELKWGNHELKAVK